MTASGLSRYCIDKIGTQCSVSSLAQAKKALHASSNLAFCPETRLIQRQSLFNNHSLSPVRFIVNSLSASISTLHCVERHLFTANSYIRTPTRPCAGYYSHGLYCGLLNKVQPHIFATCMYRNRIKAAYLFQLTLVCT